MIGTIEFVLGIVFLIIAPMVVGLFGAALAWTAMQKRAEMKRGGV